MTAALVTLPYPHRKDDIIGFVKRHHYSRRCPGVWTIAFCHVNADGRIQAVTLYGPPPYPSVARAFCRRPEDTNQLAWQARMVGAGVTSAELDTLIRFSNDELLRRGYFWAFTLTDPTARVIDGARMKLCHKGFTGEVYQRNGFLYLGATERRGREGWLIDGQPVSVRQGRVTLTAANIRQHYPEARDIRELRGGAKQRWVFVLGSTERERAERTLLMAYHARPFESLVQPRLLTRLFLQGATV